MSSWRSTGCIGSLWRIEGARQTEQYRVRRKAPQASQARPAPLKREPFCAGYAREKASPYRGGERAPAKLGRALPACHYHTLIKTAATHERLSRPWVIFCLFPVPSRRSAPRACGCRGLTGLPGSPPRRRICGAGRRRRGPASPACRCGRHR